MELGIIGLGRMGANIARRLMRAGHRCVVYDVQKASVAALAREGAVGASSIEELVRAMAAPQAVWLMLPAAFVDDTIARLRPFLAPDSILIDGGNSYYRDDIHRAADLRKNNIHFLDVGTSGGVWGLERGYCLMIGGDAEPVARLDPIFAALAPGVAAAERTPGRDKAPKSTAESGYLHCGPVGAGHFVKMIHNGIEYGIMAAYSEGLNILHKADLGKHTHDVDAETTPVRDPEYYQYQFNIPEIAELWRRGTVIRSWLLDLTASALLKEPKLESFEGHVSDSGEGRWTVTAAIDEAVPTPVLSAALFSRFSSRGQGEFADKLLSAMRYAFGGHVEKNVA